MKQLITSRTGIAGLSTIAITLFLLFGAARVLEYVLDQRLAPLLSNVLGLRVTLAPIKAELLTLNAYTERLVMGDSSDPAVDARQVMVSLPWLDLLRGRITLDHATAEQLTVNISKWPEKPGPWPDDYTFLSPWLPDTLKVQQGHYVWPSGESWPLQKLDWQRTDGNGAILALEKTFPGGELALKTTLDSLPLFLTLQDLNLELDVAAPGTLLDEAVLKLHIAPRPVSGYTLTADAEIGASALQLSASGKQAWQFPDQSLTQVSYLDPDDVAAIYRIFRVKQSAEMEEFALEEFLEKALPSARLPTHKGQVKIDEIPVAEQAVRDMDIAFSVDPTSIAISSFRVFGPTARLEGAASAHYLDDNWQAQLAADLEVSEAGDSIAARVLDGSWQWNQGRIQLQGMGSTAGTLLNSMRGDINLIGLHRGATNTPISFNAELGKDANSFTLEKLKVKLGEALISGSAALSGGRERSLIIRLGAEQLDLNFAFEGTEIEPRPGFAVPTFLGFAPGVDVDANIEVKNFSAPGLDLARLGFTMNRKPGVGIATVSALGVDAGKAGIRIKWQENPAQPTDVSMTVNLNSMNLPAMFKAKTVLIDSRTSGQMSYTSKGYGVEEIFSAMQGKTTLETQMRADSDWNRTSLAEEVFSVSGATGLVVEENRIKGFKVFDISIDTLKQDISGSLSMVAGRKPWLVAKLSSENLDVTKLLTYVPDSAQDADTANLLQTLHKVGPVDLSFTAGTLHLEEIPFQNVVITLSKEQDRLALNPLEFDFEGSHIKSSVALRWQGETAELDANGEISKLALDSFLYPLAEDKPEQLSGTIELQGQGTGFAEIADTLKAQLRLQRDPHAGSQESASRRSLHVDLERIPGGLQADIKQLTLDKSELQGQVSYEEKDEKQLSVSINGGSLDLEFWEGIDNAALENAEKAKGSTLISRAALASSLTISKMMRTPSQLLTRSKTKPTKGKIFSATPLVLSDFSALNADITGKLDTIHSTQGVADDVRFNLDLHGGKLVTTASIGDLNGGPVDFGLTLDATPQPPTIEMHGSFTDVYRNAEKTSSPHSAFISLESMGNSPAEWAAQLDGLVFFELGAGPMDRGRLSLLSADVASGMVRALIPGVGKKAPTLSCALFLANFSNGVGITPYGYAARTDTANLMGQVEMDLAKETLKMQFQSRSREGVGLSVGNVFSNTVLIKGPLSNPGIVPNTTGILWRGWAAFATAGISVLGESMLNRALASTNPCKTIRASIRKDMCQDDTPIANSTIVCPTDTPQ